MAKKIILAVAGAGKTYYICHKIDPQKRNLLLAFTRENVYNIQKELCNAYGCIPKLTTVSTFDAFTYHQLILPYEPSIAEYFGSSKFASCGISMLDPIPKTVKNNNGKTIPNPNYKNKNELRHYVTSRGQYYCANLSELVLKIKKEQNSLINRAIARLKMFYDSIFIDEFQDFREYDYDLIIALAQQYDDITLVGDYYQHSVSGTNNYGKPFKKKSIDVSYDEFVMELQNYGFEIDLNTLNKSIRCSPKVCEYINKKLGISISSCSKNTGSVIWANEKIYEILENQNIIKLVYNNAAKYSFQAMNWSYSKGDTYDEVCVILTDKFENITNDQFSTKGIPISTLNKLYVAMTRSRGNLYLIKASAFKNFKNPYLI